MSVNNKIHFIRSGFQTTIQDLGREGFQDQGVPVGGVLDSYSAKLANFLVGNEVDNPVLEITVNGPKMRFESDAQIAITGGNLSPKINSQIVRMNQTINISKGSVLSFGRLLDGCRAYLAIKGEWKVNKYLGSHSAMSQYLSYCTPQSYVQDGSALEIETAEPLKEIRKERNFHFDNDVRISVMPGPEFHLQTQKTIQYFLEQTFTISEQSNRMGIRLEEAIPDYFTREELISSGVVPGTIQLDNAGHPIILLADAQTTGGYHRIANILFEDLSLVAQLKPNDKIGFILKG